MQVVTIFIQNNKNENLIQKRSQSKGGKYGFTSGHAENNETNTQGAIREVKEELGIDIKEKQLNLFYRTKINKTIYNLYYTKLNIDIKNIELQKEEVEEVQWFDLEETYQQCSQHRDKFCVPLGGLQLVREFIKNNNNNEYKGEKQS